MDPIEGINQVIYLLGQLEVKGWGNIEKLMTANVMLSRMKDALAKAVSETTEQEEK